MAEEATQAPEITAESVAAQATEQKPVVENQEPDGTELVEMTPEQEARFKRIYGHMKQGERINKQLAQQLKDAAERIAKLESGFTETRKNDALKSLRAAKIEARESGDAAREMEIDDKIAEVRAVSTKAPPVKPVEIEENDSGFDDEEAAEFKAWGDETTNAGEAKRPWSRKGHPMFSVATSIGTAVFEHPKFKDQPLSVKLKEIDRRMAAELGESRDGATVLATNGASPRKGKPTLSPDEKRIAAMMYDGLPADQAQARYLESKTKLYGGANA